MLFITFPKCKITTKMKVTNNETQQLFNTLITIYNKPLIYTK